MPRRFDQRFGNMLLSGVTTLLRLQAAPLTKEAEKILNTRPAAFQKLQRQMRNAEKIQQLDWFELSDLVTISERKRKRKHAK